MDKSNDGELLNDNRVLNRVHRRDDAIRRRTPIASTPASILSHVHTIYGVHIVVVGATKKRSTFASPYSTLCYINPILTHIALASRIGLCIDWTLIIQPGNTPIYSKLLLIYSVVTLFPSSLIRRMINRYLILVFARV